MLRLVLIYLDSISPLLLLALALRSGNVAWRRDFIFWFIVAQVLFNGVAIVLDQGYDLPNQFLYHANCAISFGLLSLYFAQHLHLRRKNQILTVVFLLFGGFFLLNLLWWEDINSFNSNTYTLASFILVTYCFLYYLENLRHPTSARISKTPDFWFVTGIFTYYTSCSFIFFTYRYLSQHHNKELGLLWQIHNVVFLVMCVYLSLGILCKPSREKYSL
jgi:hypothetical protein